MGLAEIQKALASLYTDEELRKRFFEDPLSVGRLELGLSEDEAQKLSTISPSQLSFFSDSLTSKRLSEVTNFLPLTQKALGKNFAEAFRVFAGNYKPNGIKKHLDDAITFSKYLEKIYQKEINAPGWILDLIRFERSRLVFGNSNKRLLIKRFRFDIRPLIESLDKGESQIKVGKLKLFGIWWRLMGKEGFKWIKV